MTNELRLRECELAIFSAAVADGMVLTKGSSFPWIGTQGPYGLTGYADSVFEPVINIAVALGADLEAMRMPRRISRPSADLVHQETGVVIEVDEVQHFTTHRLATFEHYPADSILGFDMDEYKSLCRRHASTAWDTKDTATFGSKSRGRQRAFYDALKDLSMPAAGRPPVVRIAVPDRNCEAAWKNSRERVFAAVESARKSNSS